MNIINFCIKDVVYEINRVLIEHMLCVACFCVPTREWGESPEGDGER